MFCRNCGKELSSNSKFCEHCGTKVDVEVEVKNTIRKCSRCGRELEPGLSTCLYCGAVVNNPVVTNNNSSILNRPITKNLDRGPWKVFAKIGNTFGIISIILCFIPIFNIFAIALTEPGIVFSALGIKSPFNRGKAISGLVLNIIAFVLGLILYIVYAIEFGIVLYE